MSHYSACEISVVVPIMNEEECVAVLFERIRTVLQNLGRPYEVILVDDGSMDGTYGILCELARAWKGILRVVRFRRNYGQTAAMSAGFDLARGKTIVTMDGDLQNDPADIPRLLEKLEQGYDLVSGWRIKRQDASLTRKLPSCAANWLISRCTGVRIHDYGCSLKAYRAEVLKGLRFYSDMHRFFPALIANLTGARVAEIPVAHYPRTTGRSKYGLARTFRVMADIITLVVLTRFVTRPIYWFGFCAVPFLLLGTMLASFSGLIGASFALFTAGFLFVTQGILCEYVVRTGEFSLASNIRLSEAGGVGHA
ncbi:MAG: glycosyltransferase family 2 protein [Candidatus Omnitrophica bacterium]|nr:glycosyltransferase family 2 protein [Candidatus Omnitrophota bacterium]